MTTNKEIAAFTEEQHRAWLDAMTPEESMVVHTPLGHRFSIIMASWTKRALTKLEMTAGERLQFLEHLNGMVDLYFTETMLAAIQPAGDIDAKIIDEALQLDAHKKPPRNESFNLLTSWEVFGHLIRLNPSLMEAIRIREQHRQAPAVPRH